MDRAYGMDRFTSRRVDDDTGGSAAMEMYRVTNDSTTKVAQVVYWDASGQFCVETFGTDVPLELLEELISEARTSIKIS